MVKILPSPSTEWRVELNPDEQPFMFPTKSQAISFAIAWADYHPPNEICIYDQKGELQRDITLPGGKYRRIPSADRRRMRAEIAFDERRERERRQQV
jgi:hypothetical protein